MELMDLPAVGDLSEQQVRGAACVWCGIVLHSGIAVDLGQRSVRLLDGAVTMFPRSCRRCVADRAYQAILGHTMSCEQCVDEPARCDTGRALNRLIRENRR